MAGALSRASVGEVTEKDGLWKAMITCSVETFPLGVRETISSPVSRTQFLRLAFVWLSLVFSAGDNRLTPRFVRGCFLFNR